MAGYAGDALAGDLALLPQRRLSLLAQLRADLLVATHTERADCALGQLLEFLLEGVEHGRDRSVGMLRGGPFLVDLLVALAALSSSRIEGQHFLVYGGNGRFLAVGRLRRGLHDGHFPLANGFSTSRKRGLATC